MSKSTASEEICSLKYSQNGECLTSCHSDPLHSNAEVDPFVPVSACAEQSVFAFDRMLQACHLSVFCTAMQKLTLLLVYLLAV